MDLLTWELRLATDAACTTRSSFRYGLLFVSHRMMQNRTLEKLSDEKSVLSVLSALVLVAARIKTL